MGILVVLDKLTCQFERVSLSTQLLHDAARPPDDDLDILQLQLDSAQLRLSRCGARMKREVTGDKNVQDEDLQSIGEVLGKMLAAFDNAEAQSLQQNNEPWTPVGDLHSILRCISLSRVDGDIDIEEQTWMLSDYCVFGQLVSSIHDCIDELHRQSLFKHEAEDDLLCMDEALEIGKLQQSLSLEALRIITTYDQKLGEALSHVAKAHQFEVEEAV